MRTTHFANVGYVGKNCQPTLRGESKFDSRRRTAILGDEADAAVRAGATAVDHLEDEGISPLAERDRLDLVFSDARLDDRVADNLDKYDLTESESLLFGTGFGISTDIVTGFNGNLFVVSLSQGTIYEISKGAP